MGNLCGAPLSEEERAQLAAQKKLNKEINKQQDKSQNKDEMIKKLLLLGAGESGKSTLFKQMITLYGKGYPEDERITYTSIVHQNAITAVQVLLENIVAFESEIDAHIEEKNKEIADRFNELDPDCEFTEEVANDIKALWADSGIQKTFENRVKFQFPDSGPYFFERVDDMAKEDYIPSEQDVLRSRVRTTGIVETAFDIDGNQFKMFDVGGQRNERKKWIHCFQDVTCVIFVAAISEYDQTLFEDETTNRMTEALDLFDEICNSPFFEKTSVILFLNKRDLFAEKIEKVAIGDWFDDYKGPPNSYDAGCEFFREKFESRNRATDKEVYTHVTCATDTNNVSHVFNAVKDIILKQSLRDGGLI